MQNTIPDIRLENILPEIQDWFLSGNFTPFIEDNFCSSRSDFNGRLFSYENALKKKFSENCIYLVTSSLGEVGNNCFDHNLGHWQDRAGCLFIRDAQFCIIADRGQGIHNSLSQVYKLLPSEENYITVAFEKVVSGRAPEKRGNGLKFTKKNILKCKVNLFCLSAHEYAIYGEQGTGQVFIDNNFKGNGTLTYFNW